MQIDLNNREDQKENYRSEDEGWGCGSLGRFPAREYSLASRPVP